MMLRGIRSILLLSALLSVASCGGGGGGGGSDNGLSINTNACSLLGISTRIINGEQCEESASSVVRIDIFLRDGTAGTCSGTVIGKKHVLTAAHCFLLTDALQVNVKVGDSFISAKNVFVHPQAKVNETAIVLENDVAVIELSHETSIPPLPIVSSREPADDEVFAIYGYGLDEDNVYNNLRGSTMRTTATTDGILYSQFDNEGGDTCKGDSGGPAIIRLNDANGNSTLGVVAVTSAGLDEACGKGDTALFTLLSPKIILNFIKARVPDLATN